MTIRITRKTGDSALDRICSVLAKFFYGVYLAMQILLPVLFIYSIWLAITFDVLIGGLLAFWVSLPNMALFDKMMRQEEESVFRKINNKLHIFGWKEDTTSSKKEETNS